jgi:hypothetical protein
VGNHSWLLRSQLKTQGTRHRGMSRAQARRLRREANLRSLVERGATHRAWSQRYHAIVAKQTRAIPSREHARSDRRT